MLGRCQGARCFPGWQAVKARTEKGHSESRPVFLSIQRAKYKLSVSAGDVGSSLCSSGPSVRVNWNGRTRQGLFRPWEPGATMVKGVAEDAKVQALPSPPSFSAPNSTLCGVLFKILLGEIFAAANQFENLPTRCPCSKCQKLCKCQGEEDQPTTWGWMEE